MILPRIAVALRRTRFGICTVALAYLLSVSAGAVLVHLGNRPALRYRDNLVGKAWQESATLHNFGKGNRLTAAALDTAGNAAAAFTGMLAGYFPPAGYVMAMLRGFVGGAVAVDGDHHSRLAHLHDAFYYVTTLLLQLLPYSLTGGAGVSAGIASLSRRSAYTGARVRWLRLPYEAIADAGWICFVSVPLFALASLFEFLA